ncbi:MAG TPA: transposase, partial [Candidatus Angelobacter sp.]|nr:transposase [Candidatus Angelobacter sp.]
MLSAQLHTLLQRGWRLAFPSSSTHRRAMQHAIALPCVLGRRTITRTLCALGRTEQDWSADYKLFSRCRWQAEQLFQPVLDEHLARYPQGPICVAVDDTKLRKSGKKIPGTSWQRDPLSPPFHLNFLYGLR